MIRRRKTTKLDTSAGAKWLISQTGRSDPIDAVLVRVHELLKETGQATIPISIDKIAEYRRIEIIPKTKLPGYFGLLTPWRDGFKLDVKKRLYRRDNLGEYRNAYRDRYLLAHEIVHTLFFNMKGPFPKRDYPYFLNDDGEELLCDIGAEEILMPSNLFMPLLKENQVSLNLLFRLSREFKAPLLKVASRIIRCDTNYIFIVWASGNQGNKLKVVWKTCSDDFFIPMDASNSRGTVTTILDVLNRGGTKSGVERFRLGNLSGEYYVESIALYPKAVLSIIYLRQ